MALDPVLNFAECVVSTGYDAAATSIVLEAGDGAKLPAPSTDGAFNLVWFNATDYPNPANDPNVEIVRCTARSTDTLTVTRAQEGTDASTKNTGGKVYKMILGITKKTVDDERLHQAQRMQQLTDGANISWNMNSGGYAYVTLEGNRTLDNPTNIVAGGTYKIRIIQDATGTRTLAYGNQYFFPGGVDPVLSTGAADIDELTFYAHTTTKLALQNAVFDIA